MIIGSEILSWDHIPVLVGVVETLSKRYSLQGFTLWLGEKWIPRKCDSNPDLVSCQMHGRDTAGKDESFCLCHMEVSDKVRSVSWMSICPVGCVATKTLLPWWCQHYISWENWLWGELQHRLCRMKRVALQALLAAPFYYLREGLGDILTRGRQSDEHWSLGSWQTLLGQCRSATGMTPLQCHGNTAMQCCLV